MTYRIVVVDDSAFMRKIISDLIAESPELEVAGTARNGREGIEQVKRLKPDAVTMDVEMPEMDGLEALQVIMQEQPTPVIMLSSITQEGALETIRALEMGAMDFIRKPSGAISLDLYKVKQQLHEKLHAAVHANIRPAAKGAFLQSPRPLGQVNARAEVPHVHVTGSKLSMTRFEHLVAIGASTGGPRALSHIVPQLPFDFPAPVLIVQHMPPGFTRSLAQRLDSVAKLKVVEAENGQVLETRTVYIAPGGLHMTLQRAHAGGYCIKLTKEEPRSGHRPSVDVMFESLVPLTELKRHAVIMTGMGSDGAKGIQALKRNGAVTTIAESEQTCVVYGMPRAAVELHGVNEVVPQQDIARKLIQSVLAQ